MSLLVPLPLDTRKNGEFRIHYHKIKRVFPDVSLYACRGIDRVLLLLPLRRSKEEYGPTFCSLYSYGTLPYNNTLHYGTVMSFHINLNYSIVFCRAQWHPCAITEVQQ